MIQPAPNPPFVEAPSLAALPRNKPGISPPLLKWRRWKPRRVWDDQALNHIPAAWREDRAALHEKCVVAMGLGAVGGVCFEQLAKLGVGRLYGFDPDRYGPESWITQPSLAEQEGQLKADVQGRRAAQANPWAEVATAAAFAQDVPLAILRQADVIVLAGDNLELLVWAGEYAAGLGKVVVQGAVHGATRQAIVRGFDLSNPQGVCPTCLLAESDWSRLTSREGCDPATLRLQGLEPTQTLPHVCATAGLMAAAEVLKWLLKNDAAPLVGAEVQLNVGGYRALPTAFRRKANCRAPHQRWRVVNLTMSPGECSLADLAEQAGWGREPRCLAKAEIPWITRAACGSCGRVVPVRRFSRLGRQVARCQCGAAVWADLDGRRSNIPDNDLPLVWEKPLAKIGLRGGDSLAMCGDEDWTWFVLS